MNELMTLWTDATRPSAGLPILEWALLLAVAAAAGQLVQRATGLPQLIGYSAVGALAGIGGFAGAAWPLQGVGRFLLELGVAVVLFEAGARTAWRWFRHNPMVLVQSLLESGLTFAAVYAVLRTLQVDAAVAQPVAIIAMAASPSVLARIVADIRASGPVTERAIALATLNTLYALVLASALVPQLERPQAPTLQAFGPMLLGLGLSAVMAALLALALRLALRVMQPDSEATAIVLLSLIAAATALTAQLGASAALTGLLAGMLLKQLNPRPWVWPRQLGTAASMLTMLMFVLVSTMAAQGHWSFDMLGLVLVLLAVRGATRLLALVAGSFGSAMGWQQALWVGGAMLPMSSVALLLASDFATAAPALAPQISSIALPAILLMEVLGAILTTLSLARAGESTQPWGPARRAAPAPGDDHGT